MSVDYKPLNIDMASQDGYLLSWMIDYVARNSGNIMRDVFGFLAGTNVTITTDERTHETQPLHLVRRDKKDDSSDPDAYTITFFMTGATSPQDVGRSLAAAAKWIAQRAVLPPVFAWEELNFDCAGIPKGRYELPALKDAVALNVYCQLDINAYADIALKEIQTASNKVSTTLGIFAKRPAIEPESEEQKAVAQELAAKKAAEEARALIDSLIDTEIHRLMDTLDNLRIVEENMGIKPILKLNSFSIPNAVMAQVTSALWKGYDIVEPASDGQKETVRPHFQDAVDTPYVTERLKNLRQIVQVNAGTFTSLERQARTLSGTEQRRIEEPVRPARQPRGAQSLEKLGPKKQ